MVNRRRSRLVCVNEVDASRERGTATMLSPGAADQASTAWAASEYPSGLATDSATPLMISCVVPEIRRSPRGV